MQGRREEFGNYLLLKKLTEDPLGESFRAGRLGDRSLDQVVLLRAWNGSSLDSDALWTAIDARKDVQGALKSPNIGSGLDVDRVGGVPYAAYDYVSGTTLSLLAAQAEQQMSPFPTDHALLIAERLGLGLAAAHETRHGGQRIHHGFVVPDLVMISNEGETRVLGFEAGLGLAAQAGRMPAQIQRYISPEVRGGAAPASDDDVFSLGAILYELLSGTALPPVPPEGGYGGLLQRAQLASEGVPLPAEMSTLLARSLGPKGERIGDVSDWHKEISRLMAAGDYNPTTFNLAFFMHNLFRDEIERESRELEAEKTMELGPAAGASLATGTETLAVPAEEMRTAAAAGESGAVPAAAVEPRPETKSRLPLFLGIAAVLVLLLGAGWWFMNQSGDDADQLAQAATTEPEPVPTGPTPEEIQAQIDAMLDERADEMEANLQEQYDERLSALQGQLTEAQSAAAERRRQQEELRQQREAEAEAERLRLEQEAEAEAEAERIRQQQEAEAEAERLRQEREAAAEAQRLQEEQEAEEEAAAPPEPAAPAVRRGELVNDGPGVTRPSVRNKITPTYPPAARRLGRTATVDVRVLVDENGRVIDAEIEGRDPGVGFGDAAVDAARRSTFSPATKEGVQVRMWTTLRFTFG